MGKAVDEREFTPGRPTARQLVEPVDETGRIVAVRDVIRKIVVPPDLHFIRPGVRYVPMTATAAADLKRLAGERMVSQSYFCPRKRVFSRANRAAYQFLHPVKVAFTRDFRLQPARAPFCISSNSQSIAPFIRHPPLPFVRFPVPDESAEWRHLPATLRQFGWLAPAFPAEYAAISRALRAIAP